MKINDDHLEKRDEIIRKLQKEAEEKFKNKKE